MVALFRTYQYIACNMCKILRSSQTVYPESESDPGLDSCYNLELGESKGDTRSIYHESASDPELDSRLKIRRILNCRVT